MSDPVTTTEIEDVLSSIRRLVSSGESGHDEDRDQETGGSAERLVLTPSLRVDDGSPEDDDSASDDAAQEPYTAGAGDLLAAQIPIDEDEQQPQTRDTAADPSPQETTGPAEDASGGSLGKRAASFEVMLDSCDDQWEPDGGATVDHASRPRDVMAWQHDVEEDDPDPAPSDDPDHAEADEAASEAYARDWQSRERFHHRVDSPASDDWETSDALVFEDAVLDEDALRDLVADIVRQELQGALGERITRNVRKLVRREIHRALTSQDFD